MNIRSWLVLIAVVLAAADLKVAFERIVIDSSGPADIWLKSIGDLNGDGKLDLLAGGHGSGGLVWYQNPSWTKHAIDSSSKFGTDGEVADVDGNGKKDVVALTDDALVWYRQPDWTVHKIDSRRLHDIEVSDLDRDGKVDIVARNQGAFSGRGNELALYKQETPTSWKHSLLALPSNGEGLVLADIDRDGDSDIVVDRVWLENTGDILEGKWPAHEYGKNWTHPHTFVATGDINGDGRIDIVLSPAERERQMSRISWFEAPKDAKKQAWVEHVVDPDVESVHHFVGIGDFNNDRRQDIATAEMAQGQKKEVRVYLNTAQGKKWISQVIATTASHSMRIADLDGDGLLDLYGANWRSNVVELWRNATGPMKKR
jgi:FG-GAP-like repeat